MIPINLDSWIEENKEKLKPPVGNYLIQRGKDFIVMLVGGPNSRTDYHVNQTEEWFYQYKGDMLLKIIENGEFKDIVIKEKEIFLLPGNIPHNPCRFENTIGIVLERERPEGMLDEMRWYCEQCKTLVYQESFQCVDLGKQLKPVIERYYADKAKRTCSKCSHVNGIPKLIDGKAVLTHVN